MKYRFYPLALLALANLTHAQVDLTEKEFLDEMPIVLSVSRLPQRLDDTPGAVTVLDRAFIRRTGARDVADLLRWVPGFQSSTSFETLAPLASYHGAFDSYSNRLQLLIDGRSAYSPYFIGSIGPGLQTVALEDIERIEILRGSNSAAYGARAILGVVNIVTRRTSETVGGQGAITVGDNGVQDIQARLGWGQDNATFRITADQRADHGLAGSNGNNHVNRVNFRSDIFTNAGDELQFRWGQLLIDAGKGFVGNIDNAPRTSHFDSGYAQVDWRRNLGVDQDLAVIWSHAQERYEDNFLYSLVPFGINANYTVSGSGQASSDTLTVQHTLRAGPKSRVVWGGEFRSERVNSPALYATDSDFVTDFTRLFGNLEWRVDPAWVVNAGAMAERSSVTGDTFAPRLMVNWHASEGHTLRAGVSKAFRPPSDYEKFANLRYVWNGITFGVNTLATGNVQPEEVLARELGYLADFPRMGLSLDVRLFQEDITGFIRQQNNTMPRDYANDEDFAIQGAELQLKWRPWQGAQFIFNHAQTDIGSTLYGAGSSLAAPNKANSLVYFQDLPGQWGFTLAHQDSGTATLVGSGWQDRVAMTRTDVRLSKGLRWGERRGEVALTLQNIGLPYQDHNPNFTVQRGAFVTLRLDN